MSKSITRRSVTAALAAIPAAVAIGATVQAIEPDPIFAAIEAHRAANAGAFGFLGEAPSDFGPGVSEQSERYEAELSRLCGIECEAAWAMLDVEPTTVAGVAALLRYVGEYKEDGLEWPSREREADLGHVDFEDDAIAFAARSLERITMGGGNV